jgi:eukaryotic-like serine/threonine-protein kinase
VAAGSRVTIAAMAALRVVADRFELLAEVGRGAMGSVFRARDLTTGGAVAVKLTTLESALDLGRFEREAALLAAVVHPNVVGYVAHGEVGDGKHYLAQEWVDGVSARVLLRREGVTCAGGVALALGIADALTAVHALGVVHRDVKPDNVILAGGDPDRVKLVDFGIARRADAEGRLTRTGVAVGTPSYMSPEQARGEADIGAPADVWALGCVLYECLAGRAAFVGVSPAAVRAKIVLDVPPDLAVLCPEAPAELVALVEHLLAKPVADRPPGAAQVAAALRALPAIPDGKRRVVGVPEVATRAMPVRPSRTDGDDAVPVPINAEPSVLVFFGPPEGTSDQDALTLIADRHGLALHTLEDGSAILAASGDRRGAAIAAARAAREASAVLPGTAVSVIARGDGSLADAIDRGVQTIERAEIASLFGGAGAASETMDIQLDQLVAELVADELPIESTDRGAVLSTRTPGRSR